MKKFVYSAIALSMATGVSYANNGWTTLDQEISGLSSSLTAQNAGGPKVGGWVITSVTNNSDANELGFDLNEVRLHVTGDVSNDYSYKISFELEGGAADLKDAYIKWKLMDSISATMGQFYVPTFRSATSDETKLLFLSRTEIGKKLNLRDQGLMIGGNFEMLNWAVAVQDGSAPGIVPGTGNNGDDLRMTLNVTADIMGKGAGAVEGAYGAAEGTNLSVGGFIHDDGGLNDGGAFGVEAYFTMGAIAVAAEFADFDKNLGDNSPFDLTASYLFTEMYEAAIRFEDFDNAGNEDQISIGVNRYSAGHNLKWTAQYTTKSSDVAANEADEISIGATLAF